MKGLLVWSARGCVDRPQESVVRGHIEGVESMSAEMVGEVKGYDMNIHFHPGKVNVIDDALKKLIMGSIDHVDDEKKMLVQNVNRLARLGVTFMASTSRGV